MQSLTVKQAISEAKEMGKNSQFLGMLEIYILLGHVLNKPKSFLQLNNDLIVSENDYQNFIELCNLRLKGKPVAKIIGQKDFWKDRFYTNEYTLDPRPDSETLIEEVLKNYKNADEKLEIIDLGTGTGCLALSLVREYKNAHATLVDKSVDALKVAKKNAISLGLEGNTSFVESNWLDNVSGNFDIIISNPPYIPNLDIDKLDIQVNFDPEGALFGGSDGLSCYREIASSLKKVCKQTSLIFFEIGENQETDIANIMQNNGFVLHNMAKDLAGIIRVCVFKLP
ncbi:MAG: protein-(glutamine-N5) methyltransferase, release factor-specific [Alphaproteobacteria bacterium 33-17]|nr:MAG: protein-(glutamine-N5) methyltransferase, release factor-specific [Alphaproteobacteria bacterium 33-17]